MRGWRREVVCSAIPASLHRSFPLLHHAGRFCTRHKNRRSHGRTQSKHCGCRDMDFGVYFLLIHAVLLLKACIHMPSQRQTPRNPFQHAGSEQKTHKRRQKHSGTLSAMEISYLTTHGHDDTNGPAKSSLFTPLIISQSACDAGPPSLPPFFQSHRALHR